MSTGELLPADHALPELADDVAQRLVLLDALAEQHVADQTPRNTKRAYDGDWNTWLTYTNQLGIPETANTVGALVGFVVYLERLNAAPSTIDRRLAGVVVKLRERDAEPTKLVKKQARDALNGYIDRLAKAGVKLGRGKARALTVKDLRAMSAQCPPTLTGLRDRSVLLTAFGIAGRRSEVANLLVPDVVEQEEGLVIDVRYGKSGSRTPAVKYGSYELTCPCRAWREWRTAAELTEGRAFRQIDRWGHIGGGISGHTVGAIITAAGERAGLEIRFTGHSARSGLATAARRAGHDVKTIANQTGHSPTSPVLYGYLQVVDQWADNATDGLGL